MKMIFFLVLVCFMTNCVQPTQKYLSQQKDKTTAIKQPDSLNIIIQIKNFNSNYIVIEKSLYDSVKKYQNEGIDFSDITEGIERKYKESNNNFTKTLIGYKLAQNYYIHFNSTKKITYKQQAEPLFYSFLILNEGKVASSYLNLDIKKVHFIAREWHNFSEQDKNIILFYGLLRGFDDGLPDLLKSVE